MELPGISEFIQKDMTFFKYGHKARTAPICDSDLARPWHNENNKSKPNICYNFFFFHKVHLELIIYYLKECV